MKDGSLVVVGLGISIAAHATFEAKHNIREADQVLFLSYWPETAGWLSQLNPNTIDLTDLYAVGKKRSETYRQVVDRILAYVRQGKKVCAVFYGHPGVFVWPSHEAIWQARDEGYEAMMLPGISAEDCLFADLGFDPAHNGCQSYEATDFLVRPRVFDTSTALILWQIGVIGHMTPAEQGMSTPNLDVLLSRLLPAYGEDHIVYVYEAARYPNEKSLIQKAPLRYLHNAHITVLSTLYVPGKVSPEVDHNMVAQLGLTMDDL